MPRPTGLAIFFDMYGINAMLWQTQAEGTQIAFQNGGGICANIAAGDITVGDVLTVFPLENGVSQAENPKNEGAGRFPQIAGLRSQPTGRGANSKR